MPSPCEVVPDQDEQLPLMMVLESEHPPRRVAHRVIPAVAGGLFAGLLLVGLGCTPLFQPQGATAAARNDVIVQASATKAEQIENPASAEKVLTRGESSTVKPRTGVGLSGKPHASPSERSAPSGNSIDASADAHELRVSCLPEHAASTASDARPETVALQGIMAGSSGRAALLDGSLYREGDQFGARHCPWTIAMIDAASVRIEKVFGDRVLGITIRLSKKEQPHATSSSTMTSSRSR